MAKRRPETPPTGGRQRKTSEIAGMTTRPKQTRTRAMGPIAPLLIGGLLLTACSEPIDFDLRRQMGGSVDTTSAALAASSARPQPDDRGVISYPNYQVAIAQRGDSLMSLAGRVGLPAPELARFNGIRVDDPLRAGEVIALPRRVAEPSPETGAIGTGPIQPAGTVDVATLAAGAIEGAAPTPSTTPAPSAQTGIEPIRHRVARGETAFTIARLYNVTPRALAEWNALDADLTLREGQFLLIPAPQQTAAAFPADTSVSAPGAGTPTPVPPSASTPLPEDDTATPLAPAETSEPVADIGQPTAAASASMAPPVDGSIARAFSGDRNPGLVFSATAGAPVKAAASGSVISVSSGSDGIRFVLIRHPDEILTAYRFVENVLVSVGDAVSRGQTIASVAQGDPAALDFRVYRGTTPLDPAPYLE